MVEDNLQLCPTAFQPASTQLEESLSYKQEFAVSCNISTEASSLPVQTPSLNAMQWMASYH
jgi:hypothetical protein